MAGASSDFFYAVQRYPVTLFDREGIFGRLENDTWTQIARPEKYVTPDFARLRVAAYPGAEPSETRRFVMSDRRIPPGEDVPETLFRHGNPNAPNQGLGAAGHWYLQAAPNIAFSIVNGADIIGELGSGGAFGFGEAKPITRCGKPVVHREGVESPTAATASPSVIHGALFATLEEPEPVAASTQPPRQATRFNLVVLSFATRAMRAI
jgi:hypothetical protein